jgi:ATPase family protein associated with various cellular activities (AAA)/winged helix domain-containing protein
MSTTLDAERVSSNQRSVCIALEALRLRLERRAGDASSADEPSMPETPQALEELATVFGLTSFERTIVLLAAGCELSSSFAATVARLGDGRPHATFGLALAVLDDAHWSALAPGGPLRAWRLVELAGGAGLTRRELHVDEPILHWIAGLSTPDPRLEGHVAPAGPTLELTPSQRALVDRIVEAIHGQTGIPPLIELVGADSDIRLAVAAAVAAGLGRPLARAETPLGPLSSIERHELALRLKRTLLLGREALFVRAESGEGEALLHHLAGGPGLVIFDRADAGAAAWPGAWTFVVEKARGDEPRRLVRERLALAGEFAEGLETQLELAPGLVDRLTRVLPAATGRATATALLEACRRDTRARLDALARRIEPRAGWDDLVLPSECKRVLRCITNQVRHRARVHDEWGFAAASARGLGISVLFEGGSGTGKTMAAEVIARDLGLDLYHIDLSSVVSKYIGETEKNLARLFEAAEGSGSILLFDEADALFGKRSDVKDSHDRYANIEVSYLLQRMESYGGLAILTTNLKSALDTAFLRRLRFIVSFPIPDAVCRAEIWRRVFPAGTPTEGLRAEGLARLNIAGGGIRNIAISAAFLAAERDEPVGMRHVLEGARLEYAKHERPLAEAELRGLLGGPT